MRSKVGSSEVAEDLAQDALLKAISRLPTLNDPSRFGSWLLSIAHHSAQDWYKSKARTEVSLQNHASDAPAFAVVDRERTPHEICQVKEEHDLVLREVSNLPDQLREVLMIYYYDSVTYQELAEMLDVSTATINARLTQARSLLRTRLAEIGSRS